MIQMLESTKDFKTVTIIVFHEVKENSSEINKSFGILSREVETIL